MFGPYKVAHLLGLTRGNEEKFRQVETELTKMGYICFAPVVYDYEVYKEYRVMLDCMCYEKLLACDFCVVVTPEHINEKISRRIKQAFGLGKSVYVFKNGVLIPLRLEEIV